MFLSEKIKVQSVFDRKRACCNFGTARFAAWVVCHLSARVLYHLSAMVGLEIDSLVARGYKNIHRATRLRDKRSPTGY